MPIAWTYQPPKRNASLLMHAAARLAEEAGAEALLGEANRDVPVDTGRLQKSGKVTDAGERGFAVGYGFDDGDGIKAPTDQYAVKQHEDLDLDHPNGGRGKWEESAMHSSGELILAAMAPHIRQVFR